MKRTTETRREYGDHGRLLVRGACECGYRTCWYPHRETAEAQLTYHVEGHTTVPTREVAA